MLDMFGDDIHEDQVDAARDFMGSAAGNSWRYHDPYTADDARYAHLYAPNASYAPACLPGGLRQRTGTCWFNAAFNGFMLGERSARVFHRMLARIPKRELEVERKVLERSSCPRTISRAYVLREMSEFFAWPRERNKPAHAVDRARNMIGAVLPGKNMSAGDGGVGFTAAAQILRATVGLDRFVFTRATNFVPGASFRVAPQCLFVLVIAPGHAAAPLRTVVPGFQLCHAVLTLQPLRESVSHVVCAYRCGGREFVYDSNAESAVEMRWTGRDDLFAVELHFERAYDVDTAFVQYACFVRTPGSRATVFAVDPARHGLERRPPPPRLVPRT